MKFNSLVTSLLVHKIACQELRSLGFEVSLDASAKANFNPLFISTSFFFEEPSVWLYEKLDC